MEKVELKISGMHCTGCSSRLEKVLNGMNFVKATVSFENKTAVIEYDKDKISIDEITEAIYDAGFEMEE